MIKYYSVLINLNKNKKHYLNLFECILASAILSQSNKLPFRKFCDKKKKKSPLNQKKTKTDYSLHK